jgi:thioredoxin reductase (NADPH)
MNKSLNTFSIYLFDINIIIVDNMKEYDVVILGAGPAGLSAAIYSARYRLKTIVIGREFGGTANYAHKVENYPGFEGSGPVLMKKFHKQAEKFGAEFLSDDVIGIQKEKGFEVITARKEKIATRAIIVALGTQRRKLNIKGEDEFLGKGVSYCATCDGNFFRNKTVAVIGGGDSACKASELLSDIAKKVYMIASGEGDKCEVIVSQRLKKKPNFELLCNSVPQEIKGSELVEELVIETGGKKMPNLKSLKVDGVFIEIGSLPVSDVCRILGIKTSKDGYIETNVDMETNAPGIFAAGDVVKTKLKQIVVAASQGAKAAKSAYDYIKNSSQ